MTGITLGREATTDGQRKQLTRVLLDILEKSGSDDKSSVDRILARGDELKKVLLPTFQRLGASVSLVDSELLAPVDMIKLSPARISPKDIKVRATPSIEIGWIGENAQRLLTSLGDRQIEAPEIQLRIHTLRKRSLDPPIIAELGGIEQARVSLAHMMAMMEAQGHGEAGPLFVDGRANIFYLEECPDCAFYCYWRRGCRYWYLNAVPFTDQNEWYGGYQVISR